ncbi:PA2779 family protein [Vulcaniibacterium gelatinicum]|uniref:PA2779 family protein n=1 Tax=Vulcaniibacterium gelatinicum TaxID=2598725 RepID=UPI0011CC150F|nr:PA2779 family protein [Vulcaniibacterium gelatinicum]
MFRKFVVVPVVAVSLVCSGYAANVSAAVITTQEALSAEQRAAAEREVREKLARDDVRQAMLRLGVDPAEADARIAALSDAELLQVQGRLDTLPAGGDGALAVIGIVFIVLLILELTGVIDIFKRA